MNGGKVERNGWGLFLILSPELMFVKMTLTKLDQMGGWSCGFLCEHLGMDVATELLNSYLIVPRIGRNCESY